MCSRRDIINKNYFGDYKENKDVISTLMSTFHDVKQSTIIL